MKVLKLSTVDSAPAFWMIFAAVCGLIGTLVLYRRTAIVRREQLA